MRKVALSTGRQMYSLSHRHDNDVSSLALRTHPSNNTCIQETTRDALVDDGRMEEVEAPNDSRY
jgi:hypothetical protein